VNKLKQTLLKEKPVIRETTSGLTVAVWETRGFQKKYAFLSCPFGSIHNQVWINGNRVTIPEGTAHFLEHKMFVLAEGGNIFDDFAALGASCNAYTSFTTTNYLFSTWENTEECLENLLNFVQNLYLTPESIAKEKKVIEQEISMYYDHPGWRVFYNLLQNLYYKHPVRNDIAGTKESISQINEKILNLCHKTFYHPQNQILAVIGDINSGEIIDLVEENQARKSFDPYSGFSLEQIEEPEEIKNPRAREKLSISQPILHLGYKINHHPQDGIKQLERGLSFAILSDILFGTGSPGFYDLYDKGLIDDGFSAGFSGEENFGYFIMGGNTNFSDRLVEELYRVIKQAQNQGIDEKDLKRAKKKLWGSFISGLNSLEVLAGQFVKDYRRGLELADHFEVLETITKEKIEKTLQEEFNPSRSSVSLVEPEIE